MFADNPKLFVTLVLGCLTAMIAGSISDNYFDLEKAKIEASKPCKCAEDKK